MASMISENLSNGIRAGSNSDSDSYVTIKMMQEWLVYLNANREKSQKSTISREQRCVETNQKMTERNPRLQTHVALLERNADEQQVLHEQRMTIPHINERFDRLEMLLAQLIENKMEQKVHAYDSPSANAAQTSVTKDPAKVSLSTSSTPPLIRQDPCRVNQTHSILKLRNETLSPNQVQSSLISRNEPSTKKNVKLNKEKLVLPSIIQNWNGQDELLVMKGLVADDYHHDEARAGDSFIIAHPSLDESVIREPCGLENYIEQQVYVKIPARVTSEEKSKRYLKTWKFWFKARTKRCKLEEATFGWSSWLKEEKEEFIVLVFIKKSMLVPTGRVKKLLASKDVDFEAGDTIDAGFVIKVLENQQYLVYFRLEADFFKTKHKFLKQWFQSKKQELIESDHNAGKSIEVSMEVESLRALKAQLSAKKVWIASSLHRGEEVILGNHNMLLKSHLNSVVIFGPQHPHHGPNIYVVDTLGCHVGHFSHLVYSEHDENFYALNRQLHKEAESLDWTKSRIHNLTRTEVTIVALINIVKCNDQISDRSLLAVKRLSVCALGEKQFKSEMNRLGELKHPNLMLLIDYCVVKDERLLVYKEMPNGTLLSQLHNSGLCDVILDWPTRLMIGVRAAKGLVWLHHCCHPQYLHQSISSNAILLDDDFDVRIMDYELANLLYLESPSGVGFSYSNTTSELYTAIDKRTAEDAYVFLVKWFVRFPQYKHKDFYIAGESYAGHYVPQLPQIVYEKQNPDINFKGFIVGNVVIYDYHDFVGTFEYWWTHSLIFDHIYHNLRNTSEFVTSEHPTPECVKAFGDADSEQRNFDPYSIYIITCQQEAKVAEAKVADMGDAVDILSSLIELINALWELSLLDSKVKKYPNAHLEDKVSSKQDGIDRIDVPWVLVDKKKRSRRIEHKKKSD